MLHCWERECITGKGKRMDGNTIIIVHVNKSYKDIADIFSLLIKKNWPDCPYQIIYSYTPFAFEDYTGEKYESSTGLLPDNVYQIMTKYQADYAISLLGDAFITEKVDTKQFEGILETLQQYHFDYCRLFHSANKVKKLKHIRKSELYGVSFIAFICSYKYAEREFKGKSDSEFEKKYIEITRTCDNKRAAYRNIYALPNSTLCIEHGVVKGKWIRKVYSDVNKQIDVRSIGESRECMSPKEDILFNARLFMRNNLASGKLHRLISKF